MPANGPPKGFYQHPGLIPTSFFPYAFAALRPENTGGSLSNSAGDRFLYPPPSLSSTNSEKSPSSSPDKNMYYYVDPRIPFTNYFLNLTRLLNNTNSANKSCSATTPLAKVSEESRADERDHTVSPDSQTLSPRQFSAGEISATKYSAISPMEIDRKDTKPLEKLHIPAYPDPHLPNPYTSLLHTAAQSSMLPLHSGGIFHPAMMQIPGPGFRRFNPEKPPPVKKYKCDVCGKAFSRSNTLVTHKVRERFTFRCEICIMKHCFR